MLLERCTECLIALGALPERVAEVCADLARRHSERHRHYHTMAHMDHLFAELLLVLDQLIHPDCVILAIAFHDAVYDVKRSDNEERSAELARKTLGHLGLDHALIDRCASMILATKAHLPNEDPDTDLFTDADLSILGSPPEAYTRYAEQVRKEYGIYPGFLYTPGRRKVLEHFLAMDRIFKTAWFHDRYEARARLNLRTEAGLL